MDPKVFRRAREVATVVTSGPRVGISFHLLSFVSSTVFFFNYFIIHVILNVMQSNFETIVPYDLELHVGIQNDIV